MKVLFEDNFVKVEMNESGEIFVYSQNRKVKVRVSPEFDRIKITAAGNLISPWTINGLPAFVVS